MLRKDLQVFGPVGADKRKGRHLFTSTKVEGCAHGQLAVKVPPSPSPVSLSTTDVGTYIIMANSASASWRRAQAPPASGGVAMAFTNAAYAVRRSSVARV